MRSRHMRFAAALLAAVSLGADQIAFAHGGGGGGGGGGGHGGGGGMGGGHGGGFGGGHGGGFGGGHGGGFYSGGMGMGGRSFAAPSMQGPSSMGRMGSGPTISGNRGVGSMGNVGTRGLSANSHINQSLMSHSAVNRAGNLNNSLRGNSANGLTGRGNSQLTGLSRNGAGLNQAHQSQFLANHGQHNTGFRGNNVARNANLHNNFNRNNFNNFNNFNRFNRNFFFNPFFFGGFGFGGFGFWPWWAFGNPFYGYGGYGYGGYGYGGYGYGYGGYGGYYAYNPYCGYGYSGYGTDALAGANQLAADQAPADQVGEFAAAGETDFKAGNYEAAVRDWRHALLDDPNNGTLVLMLAQALFATGKNDEAAGAVQQAMMMLPDDQWGVVVSNYTELYPKVGDYTNQLRALEKAVKEKPDSPALRFLVGYHYGYLGYPADAVKQLAKAKALAPQDEMAKRLFDVFAAKAGKGDDKPAGKKEANSDLPPQAKAALPTF